MPGVPTAPGQIGRQSANHTPTNQTQPQAAKPAPIGPAADRKLATPVRPPAQEPRLPSQPPQQAAAAPPPPVESKPTVEEVKATAASLVGTAAPVAAEAQKAIPTGPKSGHPGQILPAVPLPAALLSRTSQGQASSKLGGEQSAPAMNAAALRDATQAAKAAVAVAMAKLDESTGIQQGGGVVDNLTKRVNEMRVNDARVNAARQGAPAPAATRGATVAGSGARGRGPRPAKVEVPDSDFDFASANAKFNKQEVVKEASSASPLAEAPNGGTSTPEAVADSSPAGPPAYNKSASFFDNISSEAKDRLENNGQKPGGREWRGEEQRRNMETFGQGSVDGGYRGYRGRGRGRGGRARGYRGGRGNSSFWPRDAQPPAQ